MRHRIQPFLFCLATLSLLAGCDHSHSHSDASTCANETRADAYSPGLEKTSASGNLIVRLIDSQPAPPQKGDNTFTLLLKDRAGTPLTGASLDVTPYMPDHGHGTPIKAQSSELQSPAGQYRVTPINLFMPGLWQVTVTTTSPTVPQTRESAMFSFCVEG